MEFPNEVLVGQISPDKRLVVIKIPCQEEPLDRDGAAGGLPGYPWHLITFTRNKLFQTFSRAWERVNERCERVVQCTNVPITCLSSPSCAHGNHFRRFFSNACRFYRSRVFGLRFGHENSLAKDQIEFNLVAILFRSAICLIETRRHQFSRRLRFYTVSSV